MAVSMPEPSGFEVSSQREFQNAEGFCCLLFYRKPALEATTQFMNGAVMELGVEDGVSGAVSEVFASDRVGLWTKARMSD
jgi:hypothetical protein